MAKEILLYSGIYSFVAEELIIAMNENMGSPITMRVNSGGGDVHSTWGIIAKMQEHGDVHIKVDGAAMSSAANLLMYAESVQALDVSNFVLHRADGYVSNPEDQAFLDKVNKDLKAKMTTKINADKFKEITGYTVDQLFNPETRINVYLTAKQMKDIGVVSKVTKVNPTELKAFNEQFRIAASQNPENSNPTNMTLDKLKAEHPAVYAAVVAEITENVKKAAIAEERIRVKAWLAYAAIDPVAVGKGIGEGSPMDASIMAEMAVKGMAKNGLKDAETDSPEASTAASPASEAPVAPKEKAAKEKEVDTFIQAAINLSKGKPATEVAKVVA